MKIAFIQKSQVKFPSPSRGSYFSITYPIFFANSWESFRPLPGDLISQFSVLLLLCSRAILFPSPSRGSYFSIQPHSMITRRGIWFPSPSRGSYFSITVEKNDTKESILFPSPSRGSYFSILSFTCLILTGFQSRIAAQNQIRLWNKLLSP